MCMYVKYHLQFSPQQTEDGRPWLDLAHVVSVLNKLDAGTHDKVLYSTLYLHLDILCIFH